jgi:hypothetical protein
MISSIPAVQSGLLGVRRGVERLDAAAAVAVQASLPHEADGLPARGDLLGALVDMVQARRQVEISARVVERANETDRFLLDILA